MPVTAPERIELAPGLEINRIVTGLWQVADMERGGRTLDLDAAAADMARYAEAGFDTFDMADHYGSAEDITGRFNRLVAAGRVKTPSGRPPASFTKWCPTPGEMDSGTVRAAVERSLDRMQTAKIDLLQLHWWTFEHPGYLDAMRELTVLQGEGLIGHLGLTNFDTDHLRVLVKHGLNIISNQVCFSLLDRRAADEMTEFCLAEGIKLLAYGALAGGLLGEKWLSRPEPAASDIADWSTQKYKRFVDQIGGWDVLQALLEILQAVARKHGVSIANVAARWVLDQPAVGAVIVGARLGERDHRAENVKTFEFSLDSDDSELLTAALAKTSRIPGDCGQEYRRPPYLTASGDLSHHLQSFPKVYAATPVPGRPERLRVDSGSVWEGMAGYSRAVRMGNRILVSGTTATHGSGEVICRGDPHGQAVYILDKISASLQALGGTLDEVVRTRVFLRDIGQWEPVARVHGRYFGATRPANSLVQAALVGDYDVEIEAEALVRLDPRRCTGDIGIDKSRAMDATLWNIGIKVDDIPAEAEFYVALGGRLVLHELLSMADGKAEYALVEFGGTRLFLTTRPIFEDRLAKPPPAGLTHAVFQVADVDREVEKLIALGTEVLIPPLDITAGFGSRRIAFFRSPGGLIFEVMQITT